jgi:sensor c-di-GMP phosphodiesterase-like protein
MNPTHSPTRWLVLLALALLPAILLLWLSHRQAVARAEADLEDHLRIGQKRINELLSTADIRLSRLQADTKATPSPETKKQLDRLVYDDPLFREAGLIDPAGRLVLTTAADQIPPTLIPAAQRSDPRDSRTQIVGLVRTTIMKSDSVIFARPTGLGDGSMNLLVDPELLLMYWDTLDLGPTGYLVFLRAKDNQVIAGRGAIPQSNGFFTADDASGRMRRTTMAANDRVIIHAEVSSNWVFRYWSTELLFLAPVAVCCALLVGALAWWWLNRRPGLDSELIRAMSLDELKVYYQPVVDLDSNRWVGVEALLRWKHPKHGVIAPDVFIPFAEQTGLIGELTKYVVHHAQMDLDSLLRQQRDLYVAINISPCSFSDDSLNQIARSIPREAALQPRRIIFELTERQLITAPAGELVAEMNRLADQGFRFALDDFGTGYSSFTYLLQFKFQILKLAKELLPGPDKNDSVGFVLTSVIELGNKLGLSIVAEGIETEQQLMEIHRRGVAYGQGWHFSPAIAIDELRSRIEKHNQLAG